TRRSSDLRQYHQYPSFDLNQARNHFVTLREAAQRLGISLSVVRRLIAAKNLPTSQVGACAPWQIPAEALESEATRKEVENIKNRVRAPQTSQIDGQQGLFSET